MTLDVILCHMAEDKPSGYGAAHALWKKTFGKEKKEHGLNDVDDITRKLISEFSDIPSWEGAARDEDQRAALIARIVMRTLEEAKKVVKLPQKS